MSAAGTFSGLFFWLKWLTPLRLDESNDRRTRMNCAVSVVSPGLVKSVLPAG